MKNLGHPDSFHLESARGWLELGNHLEADKELDEITPLLRAHPDVLLVRCEVYFKAKKWECLLAVAETVVKLAPDEPQAWILRSFALHELKRTQEAFDWLLPVADSFDKVWAVPYNLACYCAQLGRLEESREWFTKAMATDENVVRREAIDDPDLKPLWDSMSGTLWTRTE